MSTTKKVIRWTLKLANGSTRSFNVNADPINDTLIDEDSGNSLVQPAVNKVLAVWESDDGVKADSASIDIVATTTTTIAADVTPTS